MKRILNIAAGTCLILLMSSCSEEKKETTSNKGKVEVYEFEEQKCTYRINIDKAQANWVAYKLADKVGVNGSFKSIAIEPTKPADSPEMILEGLKASVHVTSVSTNDEPRDAKIVNSFFLTMTDSIELVAEFTGVSVSDKKDGKINGTVEMAVVMNGVSQDLHAKFNYDGSVLKVMTSLNINDFNAGSSLDELNKVCEEKHKGDGDKAVTWPDVAINLSAPIIRNCK
jgi:polyisoprenoid-binding protein YceI